MQSIAPDGTISEVRKRDSDGKPAGNAGHNCAASDPSYDDDCRPAPAPASSTTGRPALLRQLAPALARCLSMSTGKHLPSVVSSLANRHAAGNLANQPLPTSVAASPQVQHQDASSTPTNDALCNPGQNISVHDTSEQIRRRERLAAELCRTVHQQQQTHSGQQQRTSSSSGSQHDTGRGVYNRLWMEEGGHEPPSNHAEHFCIHSDDEDNKPANGANRAYFLQYQLHPCQWHC